MSKNHQKARTPSHINIIRMIAVLGLLVIIVGLIIAYLMQPHRSNVQEAQLAYIEGRYQDSVDAFTKAIAEDGSNPDNYTGRGLAYLNLSRVDLAKNDFEQAIALAPFSSDISPYLNIGKIAAADNQYEISLNYFSRATELADKGSAMAAEAYFNKGKAQTLLEDYTGALESFKIATEYAPTVPEYFQFLGDTYYSLGQLGEALNAYEQYLSLEQVENIPSYIQERVQSLRGNS